MNVQAKAEDSETTLADQMSAELATNSTCNLQDLVTPSIQLLAFLGITFDFQKDAWNYTHLEQPSTENIGNYTIDEAFVPSGLFAYYTCVDKG